MIENTINSDLNSLNNKDDENDFEIEENDILS